MYRILNFDLRFCLSGLMTLSLVFLLQASSLALAQEQDAAEALANKFSNSGDSQSESSSRTQGPASQGGGLDPEILKKIQAIKKLADAARAKAKTTSTSGQQSKPAKQASKPKSQQSEKVLPDPEMAKRKEAQRKKEAQRLVEQTRLRKEAKRARKREAEIAAKKVQAEREKAAKEKARLAEISRKKILAARAAERKRIEEQKKQREAKAAREKAEEERKLAQQRQREAQRVADAASEAAARQRDELRRLGDERRRIERNRREMEARRKDAARAADEARRVDEERRRYLQKELEDRRKRAIEREESIKTQQRRMVEAEKRRQLEEARQNQWQQAAQLARQQEGRLETNGDWMVDQRRQEADQLSNRLRHVQGSRSSLGGGDLDPPQSIVENDRRVTILLIMNVGKKGIRRWSKTADPMLCIRDKCYLSQGPSSPAKELLRSKAFGPGVALGMRGLSCRSSPACIFREVNLRSRSASLQPVDLKILRHDRRESRLIEADHSCTMVAGRLSCDKIFGTRDWRAWVVPEAVADWAGSNVLEAALHSGLR